MRRAAGGSPAPQSPHTSSGKVAARGPAMATPRPRPPAFRFRFSSGRAPNISRHAAEPPLLSIRARPEVGSGWAGAAMELSPSATLRLHPQRASGMVRITKLAFHHHKRVAPGLLTLAPVTLLRQRPPAFLRDLSLSLLASKGKLQAFGPLALCPW